MTNEDYKKLDDFYKKLKDYSFIKNEKKYTVVRKIGKANNNGTLPHTFIVRLIEADPKINVEGRLVRSIMNPLIEVEYYANDYNDTKQALKQVYDKMKEVFES